MPTIFMYGCCRVLSGGIPALPLGRVAALFTSPRFDNLNPPPKLSHALSDHVECPKQVNGSFKADWRSMNSDDPTHPGRPSPKGGGVQIGS
eukprot:632772-Pleurochrysis_carterae.AAC.5